MYDIRNMNIWKAEEQTTQRTEEFENTDITELNLSVRSFHCLKRAGCDTVGDVLQLMEGEGEGLRKIRNLGTRSEAEIHEKIEELRKEYEARHPQGNGKVRLLVRPAKKMWDRDIDEFRLSEYARTRLRNCGVRKVQDLYATNPKNEPGWYAVRELFQQMAREL